MAYRFELSFNAQKKGDPPFPSQWYIYVKEGTTSCKGIVAVTPTDCIESEIDGQIDKLIDALNDLRKKPKRNTRSCMQSVYSKVAHHKKK